MPMSCAVVMSGATLRQTELLYLVMERAESNLASYRRNQTPPHDDYREIFRQIAQGLHYLHTHPNRYVHRDIKPGNVLRIGGVWKLADFGIMQRLSGLTTVMTVQNPGTLRYMSPEANDGVISPAWDLWSLGVLMVWCLTGEHPFRQTQEKTLAQSIREDEPYFASPVPPQFEAVIRGCLTKTYRTRWTAAQVVKALMPAVISMSRQTPEQLLRLPDQINGTPLIRIPAGEFTMGSNDYRREMPVRQVYLDEYYIAKTPVTVHQYRQFCTETGHRMPSSPSFNPNWSQGEHPVVNVTWLDAMDYCDWLSEELGLTASLPTEAQWEKAARGTDARM